MRNDQKRNVANDGEWANKHRGDTKWSGEYDGHWKEIAFNVIKVGKKVDFIYLFILSSPILYLLSLALHIFLFHFHFHSSALHSFCERTESNAVHRKCSVLNFKINRRLQAAPKNKWFVFSFFYFFMCACVDFNLILPAHENYSPEHSFHLPKKHLQQQLYHRCCWSVCHVILIQMSNFNGLEIPE